MRRLALVGGVSFLLLAGGPVRPAPTAEPRCAATKVPVAPVAGSDFRRYEALTPALRIQFVSERPGVLTQAFPEPPVRIVQRARGAACQIREGGVWSSDGVYVGANGQRLLLLETSGASATLVVYAARSCARQGEIDVSEARWRFTDEGMEIGRDCSGTTLDECKTRQRVTLDAHCIGAAK